MLASRKGLLFGVYLGRTELFEMNVYFDS